MTKEECRQRILDWKKEKETQSKYKIVLTNDETTDKDFLIDSLKAYFNLSRKQAYLMVQDAEKNGLVTVKENLELDIALTFKQIIEIEARCSDFNDLKLDIIQERNC